MAELLTEDVWALILQHVPVADRLKHCALACQKLSRAAAAATVALEVSLWRHSQEQQKQRAEAFGSYLQHHGRHVASLVLQNGDQPLTQLPCPALLHLDISRVLPVQLGSHGGLPGVLDSCATGLTSLKLLYCEVTPAGALSSLSVLVDLRELQMQHVRQLNPDHAALPGSVLPSLTRLTRLDLSNVSGVADLHHVSSLTNLSVLRIVRIYEPPPRLARNIAPGVALPASLQQLCLGYSVELDPAVFAAATQLTHVELADLTVATGGGVSSGAALLAAVAALQQLDTLLLCGLNGVDWPAPCAAYSALTASSKLQKLSVRHFGLPDGVWEHVFAPPARRCPALRYFAAGCLGEYVFPEMWDAEEMSSLVECCPGLQDLELRLTGGAPVAELELLTSLTCLELIVDCTDEMERMRDSAQRIAAVTSLQDLTLRVLAPDEGDGTAAAGAAALLPLTALRQLTRCDVKLDAPLVVGHDTIADVLATNKAGPGQPPDVWLQVLEQCLEQSNCQPAVTAVAKRLTARLEQQEQRLGQQEQQIAVLQAQVQQLLQLLPQQQQH